MSNLLRDILKVWESAKDDPDLYKDFIVEARLRFTYQDLDVLEVLFDRDTLGLTEKEAAEFRRFLASCRTNPT